MIDIEEIIYGDLIKVIETWKDTDIYAISFFVYDDNDDVNRPTLTVGYNTESFYRASFTNKSEETEARWNYAFWPQMDEYHIGYENDPRTRQWIVENHLTGFMITKSFIEALVHISIKLHETNVIEKKFGKSLPIIIHELEYYDIIAEQTKRANLNGEADDFYNWIMDMYK